MVAGHETTPIGHPEKLAALRTAIAEAEESPLLDGEEVFAALLREVTAKKVDTENQSVPRDPLSP